MLNGIVLGNSKIAFGGQIHCLYRSTVFSESSALAETVDFWTEVTERALSLCFFVFVFRAADRVGSGRSVGKPVGR